MVRCLPRSAQSRPSDAEIYAALGGVEAYPADLSAGAGVTSVQTHISWVFLTAERVYKLRKPVRFGFLDFGTRQLRDADCLQEVRLNRRLAPDVYLGVAPVLHAGGRIHVGPERESLSPSRATRVLEHCVVMRRLPADQDGLSLLQAGRLGVRELNTVAETIADFHRPASLGIPAPFSPDEWRQRLTGPVHDNLRLLAEATGSVLERAEVEHLSAAVAARERDLGEDFERRRREGRAVDGHGDLHLQHIWFEPGKQAPVIIDCVEFNERLRRIDRASDSAFLAMDLRYRGHAKLAERFLAAYARASGDYHLYSVVDYFLSYRAAVRAKVAALAAMDPGIPAAQREAATASARRHLDQARASIVVDRQPRDRDRPLVIAMCGVIGSGKSTAAERLAEQLDAVVISSDRLRRQLAALGVIAGASGQADEGLYSDAMRTRVYHAMLECGDPVLASGRTVVLDATHGLQRDRQQVREWASRRGANTVLVQTLAAGPVTMGRLRARAARGDDASDAGPELYATAAAAFEAPSEWPSVHRFAISTDTEAWQTELNRIGDRLAALRSS